MDLSYFASLAMDNQDSLCYASDMDTYELLYLNKVCMDTIGVTKHSEYLGKKCYKILQGKDKPCDFCNNSALEPGKALNWEFYNPILVAHFSLIDKMFIVDGKKVRLEIATNINEQKELEKKLSAEQTLIRCVQTLSENISVDVAINNLLAIVSEYYESLRAYIFEINYEKEIVTNTYEWCSENATPEIENLLAVPIDHMARWLKFFEEDGKLFISSVGKEIDVNSFEYEALTAQNIETLMAVPLIRNDIITGFIGIDDPKQHLADFKLLRSLALFIQNDLSKRRLHEKLEYMSYVDTLTGAYNRHKYMELIEDLEKNPPSKIGILFADINGLKIANEIHGQAYGDYLIVNCANLLYKYFDKTVYRIGGDEFIALCLNSDKDSFMSKVDSLREYIKNDAECSLSVASVWKSGKINVLKEIAYTDELMFVEKQGYYKSTLPDKAAYRLNSAQELAYEIESGMFTVYLQPKVHLASGKISAAEALIRKFDSEGKIVPPYKFIPKYEQEKIIRHVDYFVLETVCKTLREWIKNNHPIKISVNFSRVTFMEHNMSSNITAMCAKYGIPHKYIDIEVTESSNKMDNEILVEKILEIKKLGFSISLDDFGAQYSNLMMLSTADFNEVKIDKSLVDNLCICKKNKLIMEQSINLIETLNPHTSLAEGVETNEQYEILKKLACTYAQGYLFFKPMPIDQFIKIYLEQL